MAAIRRCLSEPRPGQEAFEAEPLHRQSAHDQCRESRVRTGYGLDHQAVGNCGCDEPASGIRDSRSPGVADDGNELTYARTGEHTWDAVGLVVLVQ